jgi:hypothetical protein
LGQLAAAVANQRDKMVQQHSSRSACSSCVEWMRLASFVGCAVLQLANMVLAYNFIAAAAAVWFVAVWLQGGATHFDHLGISVQPQQGMALLFFPSYANGTADPR